MGLSIHYRSIQPMHPAAAFEIKKQASELNDLYAWNGCEEVVLEQRTDGILAGSSVTSFVVDAEFLAADASLDSAGDIARLIDVLCELSRCHEVDWEIEHDYEPEVVGCIREGIADIELIEELETIQTIGEMLGDFDEHELETDHMIEVPDAEDYEGPRLLKFPGLD